MYIRQAKNDSVDSFIIAQIMRFGEFSESSFSDEDAFALRNLSRYRFSLLDECSNWKRKLIAILYQVFPEYSKLFSKYSLPEDMLSVSTSSLDELISKCSKDRFDMDKAKEIK